MEGERDLERILAGERLSPVLIAAHELKAPLALVRQLALELQIDELPRRQQFELLEQISLTTERSLDLVSGLTRASRLEDSLFVTEAVNLTAVCEEAAHQLLPLYRAHGRELQVIRRSRPVMAVANRELLGRIVRQLADNALHYSEPTAPVQLSTQSVNGKVRLSVRDHGPALTNRLNLKSKGRARAVSERPESSGLGLMISEQFARRMQGQIGLVRHRDGASFYVELNKSRQLSLI